ncbi:AmmeMemoRadiSam system protein A [Methylocucumis oryzae]|uniref:AMMECR1 domain-containing protein n=1 Tax=Methylocucumis oryzae TaxID=1632867 RepID=A0A0F3IE88_9GAMM|nr:AmmeMemoRadiSam system protein A [Methylocucumis oryzae]KJV05110.1 hypothetical protein VZ94_20545 [Methylocucumis oryzae]
MSLTSEQQQILLTLAKASIVHGLTYGKALTPSLEDYPDSLLKPAATFVTLNKQQQLRGCIGMLEPVRLLPIDIAENAYAAAFKDPRFPPLQSSELALIDIHIAILTAPEPMTFSSESDLLAQLQPGIDGLILSEGFRRSTFLPAVWQSLPKPQQFLNHLKQKAGLPASYWSDTLTIARYRTESFPDDMT